MPTLYEHQCQSVFPLDLSGSLLDSGVDNEEVALWQQAWLSMLQAQLNWNLSLQKKCKIPCHRSKILVDQVRVQITERAISRCE